MNIVAKCIREATGLTLVEFCANYLDSDWQAFSVRLRKGRLYPNEAFLICIITGKNPSEIFETSALEVFCLKGKSKVTNIIMDLLSNPNAMEKANLILSDPTGLKINLPQNQLTLSKKKEPAKRNNQGNKKATPKLETKSKQSTEEEFDFVDASIFK